MEQIWSKCGNDLKITKKRDKYMKISQKLQEFMHILFKNLAQQFVLKISHNFFSVKSHLEKYLFTLKK